LRIIFPRYFLFTKSWKTSILLSFLYRSFHLWKTKWHSLLHLIYTVFQDFINTNSFHPISIPCHLVTPLSFRKFTFSSNQPCHLLIIASSIYRRIPSHREISRISNHRLRYVLWTFFSVFPLFS
jgi:hypothetical protein